MANLPHRCDERCVCPVDGKQMFYSATESQHACQDPDCENAHGMWVDFPRFGKVAI